MNRVVIPPKRLGETVILNPWNFISLLSVSETISSATVTATVYSGIDANPSAMISGSTTITGTVVSQKIVGGVVGVVYELLCAAVTSAGQTLQLAGYFAVIPDLP
jgi:flagellar biosynthesis protein FliR